MLKQRIITAIVLAVATIWALFEASDMGWKVSLLVVAAIAAWEWGGFAQFKLPVLKAIYALGVVVCSNFVIDYASTEQIAIFTAVETFLLLFVVHKYQATQGNVGLSSPVLVATAGVLAVSLFVTVLYKFRFEFGPLLLLLSMALVWAIDTGAYFSGRKFGKNKLAVHVSPGKTWEGVIGGGLLAFVLAIFALFIMDVELALAKFLFAVVLGLIAVFSVYGDLFESVLKRQVGLKDSGQSLPGHGGVLDRVDSLIIALPMFYLAWHYLLA